MTNQYRITVLGDGNNAQTMAADLALAGHQVILCDLPQFSRNIQPLMKTRQLEKYGSVGTTGRTGLATLESVTTDINEAIKGRDIILIAVPAYKHMAFFEAMAELLEDGQIVFIVPGNWGALRLFNLLKEKNISTKVKIAETHACMYICRAAEPFLGPGKVRIVVQRDIVQLAAMPAIDTDYVFKKVSPLFSELVPANNVLETSLNNGNLVIHGPLMLMNAGWLEHTNGHFMIYRDGFTPSVGRTADTIGDERDAIIRGLGLPVLPREPFYDRIKAAQWPHDPCEEGPPNLRHRYITEDVPYGMVPMAYLGDLFGLATPVSDAIIELASCSNQCDYWKEGLTLESLNLAGLRVDEIRKIADEGSL
jgi:opine dehydrogenase